MTELSLTQSPRRLKWALIALISVATVTVFWGTLQADFLQWDDDINIYDNAHIQGLTTENLKWMLTAITRVRRYTPLTWLGFGLDYHLYQLNPMGYHLSNVLLQACNAVFVFLLIRRLLIIGVKDARNDAKEKQILWFAAIGALYWAIHPLRVEVVAWASGRIYCQAMLFLLLSLLSYLRFAQAAPAGTSRATFYWLSVTALAASLLTYPLALAYVAVLIVLDFYPLRRLGWSGSLWDTAARRVWLEKVPFLVVVGLVFGITVWARINTSAYWEPPPSLAQFGLFSRAMQAFYIWHYYVWKPWAPFHLAPVYTTLVQFQPTEWKFVLSAAVIIALTALLVWQRKRWPLGLALWSCHLIWLVPVLGLMEHPHYPSDRYTYMVGILWSILLAAGLVKFWDNVAVRVAAPPIVIGVLALLGWLSSQQTRVWRNTYTLFSHVIRELDSESYRGEMYFRLAFFQLTQRQNEAAAANFREAIQRRPDLADAQSGLGDALSNLGRVADALPHYETALRLAPTNASVRMNFGIALAQAGKVDRAEAQFRAVLSANPSNANAHQNLAVALAQQGKVEEARTHQAEAKRLSDQSRDMKTR
jgi:Tfp pilus assembly protein PilF